MNKYKIAKDRYIQGETIKNICKDLQISNVHLSYYLQLNGIEMRGVRKADFVSQEKKELILDSRSCGKSIREIEKELKIHRSKISFILKNLNASTNNLNNHEYTSNIFEIIDNEEKAYWLGMLFADGHMYENKKSVCLTLQNLDRYHLEKFADFMGNAKVIYHSKNASRVSVSNEKIYNDVLSKGCLVKKSLILKFPNKDIVPEYLIHHFIRGYFDGDGGLFIETSNINKKTKSLLFYITGTYSFLEKIKIILSINNKLLKESKNGNVYTLRVKGNNKSIKILEYLYNGATIYLDRKYNIYKQFLSLKKALPSNEKVVNSLDYEWGKSVKALTC